MPSRAHVYDIGIIHLSDKLVNVILTYIFYIFLSIMSLFLPFLLFCFCHLFQFIFVIFPIFPFFIVSFILICYNTENFLLIN